MTKKRGNPNWGKPDVDSARNSGPTTFEEIVRRLSLAPEDYQHSIPLKEWAKKNKDQKYVPLDLLQARDFEAKRES